MVLIRAMSLRVLMQLAGIFQLLGDGLGAQEHEKMLLLFDQLCFKVRRSHARVF